MSSQTRRSTGFDAGARRSLLRVVASAAAAVLVLEGLCRIFMGNLGLPAMELDPPDGRCVSLLPNTATHYTGWALRSPPVSHDVNGLGYRGVERDHVKEPGVTRILFIGDSFVYGQGGSAAEALPATLERVLAESGRQVEVLNFGVPGYNLEENVDQYRLFASKWEHDLVLVALVDNDLSAPFCAMASHRRWSWVLKNVYLYRAGYLIWSITFTREHGSPETADDPSRLEARLRHGLAEISRISRERGAGAALILLARDRISDLPISVLDKANRDVHVPTLPARSCTPDGNVPTLPREGHFSAHGNRLLAKCIADWLSASGQLAGPSR